MVESCEEINRMNRSNNLLSSIFVNSRRADRMTVTIDSAPLSCASRPLTFAASSVANVVFPTPTADCDDRDRLGYGQRGGKKSGRKKRGRKRKGKQERKVVTAIK